MHYPESNMLPHLFRHPRLFRNMTVILVSSFSFAASWKKNCHFHKCGLHQIVHLWNQVWTLQAGIADVLHCLPVSVTHGSWLMLHVVFRYTLMVIRSRSPTSPHFLDQFLPAGGENLPLVRRSQLFHQPCALYLPGQSAPSCLWMLPSRSCEYDTIYRPGNRRVRRSELHSQPKWERAPLPRPRPPPGAWLRTRVGFYF